MVTRSHQIPPPPPDGAPAAPEQTGPPFATERGRTEPGAGGGVCFREVGRSARGSTSLLNLLQLQYKRLNHWFLFRFFRFWTSQTATGPPSPCRDAAAALRASPRRAPWILSSCPRPSPPALSTHCFCRPQVLPVRSTRPVSPRRSLPVPRGSQVRPPSTAQPRRSIFLAFLNQTWVCFSGQNQPTARRRVRPHRSRRFQPSHRCSSPAPPLLAPTKPAPSCASLQKAASECVRVRKRRKSYFFVLTAPRLKGFR